MNDYIAYLNSMHNMRPGGANALAESQALNKHFKDLYEPFPLADALVNAFSQQRDRVIILTGHAGDGKTTVALDVFRRLSGNTSGEPLTTPMAEFVRVTTSGDRAVSIIKDMSELSLEERSERISNSFSTPGSALIISNTGPLLKALGEYSTQFKLEVDTESEILRLMDLPFEAADFTMHTIFGFPKELVIINMARIDNVPAAVKVLGKMVRHPSWNACSGCNVESDCPLRRNRATIIESGSLVEERVRWIYQRLNAYEQRLTMRQMVAHLALSLTGGLACSDAKASVAEGTASGSAAHGLERVLFSEGFFGYCHGEDWPEASGLHAIALLRRQSFGGPVAVDFARQSQLAHEKKWIQIPEALENIRSKWGQFGADSSGVRLRAANRRMEYFFGAPNTAVKEADSQFNIFLDAFLRSPTVRAFDDWRSSGKITLDSGALGRLKRSVFNVLLEFYSGFSTGQFHANDDRLYLTLRRPDKSVVQPTQLVVAILYFRDFDMRYDARRGLPYLTYRKDRARLTLTLPLFDYIQDRNRGNLGKGLAPIHLAQLELFRAQLLAAEADAADGEIALLRADISGAATLYRYAPIDNNQQLEKL